MPLFGYAKKRIGNQLGSAAMTGEGTQNILCAYLSVAILVGLAANALVGWWADPLVALLVAVVAVQAGLRTWRGEGCASVCWVRRRHPASWFAVRRNQGAGSGDSPDVSALEPRQALEP